MKMKRVAINSTAFIILLVVLKVAYDFQPKHYKLVLPQESDLNINPKLRSVSSLVEYYDVRNQIHSLLTLWISWLSGMYSNTHSYPSISIIEIFFIVRESY